MAAVSILFSVELDKFYIGSCLDLEKRLSDHKDRKYKNAFTSKVDDWELFFYFEGLSFNQARSVEQHVKKMKSKKYIHDLKAYPEIAERLRIKYKCLGSSR